MKNALFVIPFFAATALLASCGSESETPVPATPATAEPAAGPSLPAPDQETFTRIFAESCEGAEPVNTAVCKRAMGADIVTCDYGLGEDTYLRHSAGITASEDGTEWVLADPAKICAEHGAHHTAS